MGDDIARWTEIRERFERLDCGGMKPPGINGTVTPWLTQVCINPADSPAVTKAFRVVVIEAGRAIVTTAARNLFPPGDLEIAEVGDCGPPQDEDPADRHARLDMERRHEEREHVERWCQFILNRADKDDSFCTVGGGYDIAAYTVRDALQESIAACDWIAAGLRAMPAPAAESSVGEGAAVGDGKPVVPKVYLRSWREILDSLGSPNDDTNRRRVADANRTHDGPIVTPGQGAQPFVEKGKLVAWWNALEDRFQEIANRERDRKATVAETFLHGTDSAIVVPEIRGSVKPRKRRKG